MKAEEHTYEKLKSNIERLTKLIESVEFNSTFQNKEKIELTQELLFTSQDLVLQKEENERRVSELIATNIEIRHLLQVNIDKNRFIEIFSHDLRSPIGAILGLLNILSENIHSYTPAELADHINSIRYSVQNTHNLLEDLSLWSMSQSGKLLYEPAVLNIFDMCQGVVELLQFNAKSKNISILCKVQKDITSIADKNMFNTILRNLISNAIKFTNPGGYIEILTNIRQSNIEISIVDTGIGISPEMLDKLFNISKTFTTKGTLNENGTGLGLSLCKEFSEKLGGSISVNSVEGQGSTFTLTIPYGSNRMNIDNSVSNDNFSHNWNGKTILIVEDEINSHYYIEALLSQYKVLLLHAWNGIQAIEQVKDHLDISLVLMDIKMPLMNGYEAALLIKKMRPELPVIAQTAYTFSHDKSEMLRAGFDNYIGKPIPEAALVRLIDGYLWKST